MEDTKLILEGLAEIKTEMRELRTEVDEVKVEVRELRTEVDEVKAELQETKEEVYTLKSEQAGIKTQLQAVETGQAKLRQQMTDIQLTLENETNQNIKIIAEAHLDLSRKLDTALKVENEKEILLIRVNRIENELRQVKDQVREIAAS